MADIKQIHVGNTNYNISGAPIVLEDNGTTTDGVWLAKTNQITSLVDGQLFLYKIVNNLNNDSATLTITANGVSLGSKQVTGPMYQEVVANYGITHNFYIGETILLVYNATYSKFQMINGTPQFLTNITKIFDSRTSSPCKYIRFLPEENGEVKVYSVGSTFTIKEEGFKFSPYDGGCLDICGYSDSSDGKYLSLDGDMEIHTTKIYSSYLHFASSDSYLSIGEINGTKIRINSDDGYDKDFHIKAISNIDCEGLYLNRPIYISDPNDDGNCDSAQRVLTENDIADISSEVGNNLKYYTNEWEAKTWSGMTSFYGREIWTDGDNIYYSNNSNQYVLNKATSTWTTKTWTGLTNFYGEYVWTDGDNIYYSDGTTQKVLNKSTSTWSNKTWTGLINFSGYYVWTDGDNVYYSSGSDQYVLNKSTSTWNVKTWNGWSEISGDYIWTDGNNIYYSWPVEPGDNQQYMLNKNTSTWSEKIWTGIPVNELDGHEIWTDGDNIYYSYGTYQKVLNKTTSTWSNKTWTGLINFSGYYVWTDGSNIYYSNSTSHYQLKSIPLKEKVSDLEEQYSELVSITNGVLELD